MGTTKTSLQEDFVLIQRQFVPDLVDKTDQGMERQ